MKRILALALSITLLAILPVNITSYATDEFDLQTQDTIKEKLNKEKKQLNDDDLEKVTGGTGDPPDPEKPETVSGLQFDLQVFR